MRLYTNRRIRYSLNIVTHGSATVKTNMKAFSFFRYYKSDRKEMIKRLFRLHGEDAQGMLERQLAGAHGFYDVRGDPQAIVRLAPG